MTSRLASLLVQEGLVSAKKMAQVFQRQVIYGGTLDTILLEMDAVDEGTLLEAMGRAGGMPTAGDLPPKTQLEALNAPEWMPHPTSERFRAVPISVDGNVVRVLVLDPPDRKQLDELGYMVSRSIDPIIAPEYRFAQAVEQVYGVATPARFASLAKKLRQRALPSKVVSIDADLPPPRAPEPIAPTVTAPPTAVTRQMQVVSEDAFASTQETPIIAPPPERAVVTDVPMPKMPATSTAPLPLVATTAPAPAAAAGGTPTAVPREVSMVAAEGPHEGPSTTLPILDAQELIEDAPDRDAIFRALCRGARSQVEFVALLMVHGEQAVGKLALGADWLSRDDAGAVSVPLDKPSPFRAAAVGKAPYLGRIGEDNLGANALAVLGRKGPLPGALVPILLKERAVALIYGDAAGKQLEPTVLAELSTLAAAAARSFQRLILKQKGADYQKAAPTAAKSAKAGKAGKAAQASALAATAEAGGWKRADSSEGRARLTTPGFNALSAEQAQAVMQEPEAPKTVHDEPTRPLPQIQDMPSLLESVLRENPDAAAACDLLLRLGERGAIAAVGALPGPLKIDRHALKGAPPPLAEHGPLLALIAKFGKQAAPSLQSRTTDGSLEVRYYATLALGELKLPESVHSLGNRLMDADAGVRHAAVNGLSRMEPSNELRTLTESLRGELPGPEALRQRYASEALGALRDVPSVPRLIELVKHEDPLVVSASRRALIEITKQDFGTSRWRWRSWWDRHRHEQRTEWLLEGLGHAEADVRHSASEELRTLSSGEVFGYHFDLPKREREEARRKWVDWWRTHGQKQPRT
jgi:hypothetical protein